MVWLSQFAFQAWVFVLEQSEAFCFLGGLVVGIATVILPRWIRRHRLRSTVESLFMDFRRVCEPETLDPNARGNPVFMRSHARDAANKLIGRFRRAGLHPPPPCDESAESLAEWFAYLGKLRVDLN